MTNEWISFLKEIEDAVLKIGESGSATICFRGQADNSWDLLPSLFVKKKQKKLTNSRIAKIENNLFFDFITNAGALLKPNLQDWDILFEMRHHGLPTRILDWTEDFGTALYFALDGHGDTPTIWILDPFQLNSISYNGEIPNPCKDFEFSYSEAYIEKKKNPFNDPIAIIAPRTSDRLFAQKGLFVLQGSDQTPMNRNSKVAKCFKQIDIPLIALNDAKMFLKLAGINDYSIMPDLDGLAHHLNKLYNLD